jgi:uncharacterized protein YneF (UPF0154 family)
MFNFYGLHGNRGSKTIKILSKIYQKIGSETGCFFIKKIIKKMGRKTSKKRVKKMRFSGVFFYQKNRGFRGCFFIKKIIKKMGRKTSKKRVKKMRFSGVENRVPETSVWGSKTGSQNPRFGGSRRAGLGVPNPPKTGSGMSP